MKIKINQRHILYGSIALLLVFAAAFTLAKTRDNWPLSPKPSPTAGHSVDPLFKEFFDTLGGEAVLGRPITQLFERDNERCQYTEAALMCSAAETGDLIRRFYLDDLGTGLGVREQAVPVPSEAGSRDLGEGFFLFPDFAALYDRLYGAIYIGRPLTQVRVNQTYQRYEQYFENLGFYRRFDDPPEMVHLLPYGAYRCGPDCSSRLDEYWITQQSGEIAQPFQFEIQRRGWTALGEPLAPPTRSTTGEIEQVYDNAVVFAPDDEIANIGLRPLVPLLDFVPVEDLAAPQRHDQLVFYEVADGLGHNVPLFFDRFINQLGGPAIAGTPLTEMFVLEPERLYRQCFTNYCLEYDALAPEQRRVRMVALGSEYLRRNDPGQILRQAFSPETVHLTVEEAQPQLRSGERQRVTAHVYQSRDNSPMYLVEGTLTLTYPGRPSQTLYLQPTDAAGRTQIEFEVPKDLENLSIVEYRVCLNLPSDPRLCATESFLYRNR
jgi:hypothetical protein